jgi:hypothetical protein
MTDTKLWKQFSLFIRLRDTDENGFGKCFTCGRIIHYTKGDCGHGIGRQHKSVKYNEKNNHLQCKPCNGFEGGRREIYKERVNELYGPNTWELLELAAKQPSKRSQFDIDVLTKYYTEQVKILKAKKAA